jgi:hypothetical protein
MIIPVWGDKGAHNLASYTDLRMTVPPCLARVVNVKLEVPVTISTVSLDNIHGMRLKVASRDKNSNMHRLG